MKITKEEISQYKAFKEMYGDNWQDAMKMALRAEFRESINFATSIDNIDTMLQLIDKAAANYKRKKANLMAQ